MNKSSARTSTWRAVGYVRLSREDEALGESTSIASQKMLIEDWAIARGNVQVIDYYTDDGYSGATFQRPGFERMMDDARSRRFDTIVVKDLSRFGRSYLDCGNLIERELPQLGVRLFSIGDCFDSMERYDLNTALLLPIKNLMNEMHVATTSEKVRASLAAKRQRGECVANWAPYGYVKDPVDRHRLIVDTRAAKVVRDIFEMRVQGWTAAAIARRLNEKHVPCPSQYRKMHGQAYATGFEGENPRWHANTILRILRNEAYVGTLVQGKTHRPSWRIRADLPVPREDWVRMPRQHEGIVDTRLFEQVRELVGP